MESINFPLTKSQRVRKDEGKPGGKIADKLGRMVVRNTQPMPLTSWRAASRAPLSLPHLLSHKSVEKHALYTSGNNNCTTPIFLE